MARESNLEPGSSENAFDDIDGPSVERSDLPDDRQPEAAPAGVPISSLVEPDEPVEDPDPLLALDPRSVVVDAEHHLSVPLEQGEGDRRAGVSSRVLGQVADQPSELLAVTPHPARRDTADVDPQFRRAAETFRLFE